MRLTDDEVVVSCGGVGRHLTFGPALRQVESGGHGMHYHIKGESEWIEGPGEENMLTVVQVFAVAPIGPVTEDDEAAVVHLFLWYIVGFCELASVVASVRQGGLLTPCHIAPFANGPRLLIGLRRGDGWIPCDESLRRIPQGRCDSTEREKDSEYEGDDGEHCGLWYELRGDG